MYCFKLYDFVVIHSQLHMVVVLKLQQFKTKTFITLQFPLSNSLLHLNQYFVLVIVCHVYAYVPPL